MLITVLFAAVVTAVPVSDSIAENPVPTDFEILAELFSSCTQKIIEPHIHSVFEKSRGNARVSYTGGIGLSAQAKEYFEAILTESGLSISGDRNNSDYYFTVSVSDARVILAENDSGYERTARVNVHVNCMDSSNTMLFAGGNSESYQDTLTKKSSRISNNSRTFSRDVKRHLIRSKFNRIRIVSLLTVTAALAYFAFE